MKSLILTGGLGSRLYPITKITPKPLLDVKGKPVLAHIVDSLDASKQIEEISIMYPHQFESQFKSFETYLGYEKRIELISDKNRIVDEMPGSIGAIAYVVKHKSINDDLLVVAGDNLFDFNIDDFINFYHTHRKTSIAVYEFGNKSEVTKFGVVELDRNNKIISFEEKPHHPRTSLVSTLCYILSRHDLHHLEKKIFKENAGELIRHLVENGQDIYGYQFRGKWFDIGTFEDLDRARKDF